MSTLYLTTPAHHDTPMMQVDLFFATLTVREHLQFHAMVRVSKEVAVRDRLKRVEEVRGRVRVRFGG